MRATLPHEAIVVDHPLLFVPFSRTMAAADPFLPAVLVDARAHRALGDITDRLPAALTRRAYIECRLAARASRVDLVLCVDASSRTLLIDLQRAWLPGDVQAHPLWTGLGRLCSQWAEPQSRVGAAIYDLWLEFDAEEHPSHRHALVPSVFVGSKRSVTTTPIQACSGGLDALETLLDRPFEPHLTVASHEVVVRLPIGANVPYVGVMYPRSQKTLRLCVGPLAGRALLDYLGSIGWPGDVDALADLLRSIPYGPDKTTLDATTLLHLDIEQDVQPRIGLEVPLPQYPRSIDGPAERELFEALCDRGLCAPAKHAALVRWPGHALERFPHQCWPSVALRGVNHVKIVHDPRPGTTGATEVKTYLSYFHHFVKNKGDDE